MDAGGRAGLTGWLAGGQSPAMQRVMIVGQPGSGKSALARDMGAITHLPVFHIVRIHWMPGWVERPGPERDALCAGVHARDCWIFEGGWSRTYPERLARADTVIWLDLPVGQRLGRVLRRSLYYWGRARPDLPDRCRERVDPSFLKWIWDTRKTSRLSLAAFWEGIPAHKARHRLTSAREVRAYLAGLSEAVALGNLGIPHR